MNDMIVKNVDVMGDSIMAAKDSSDNVWVGVRWICDALDMTEGQMKRQIKNIRKDIVFSKGGSNQIPLPTGSGVQEVFCIRNDFIPLWLAKIAITEKTRQERPEFAEKLLEYQLRAKDILADAFNPKHSQLPQTTDGKIALLAQGHMELRQEINAVRDDLEAFKMDLPILPIEASRITEAVKGKGVSVMGGKKSNAYKDRGIVNSVYHDIYEQLYRNFGVKSYKAIKRSQCDKAVEIIRKYEMPMVLANRIDNINAQQILDLGV